MCRWFLHVLKYLAVCLSALLMSSELEANVKHRGTELDKTLYITPLHSEFNSFCCLVFDSIKEYACCREHKSHSSNEAISLRTDQT